MTNPTPPGPRPPQHDASDRPIVGELESRPTQAIKVSDLDAIAGESAPRARPLWWRIVTDPFSLVVFGAIALVVIVALIPRGLWLLNPAPTLRVALVDYTVPYATAREHRGVTWALNHLKYTAPTGRPFARLGTHIGYQPDDRANPTTIAGSDLSRIDWLFVADAYGVYAADLIEPERERGHRDYSARVFGGLSDADADSIVAFSRRGGHVLMEFNALERPTEDPARAKLQALLGVEWTGWVGRTFETLRDTVDVPKWVGRRYRELYGDRPLPRGRALLLVHDDGRMLIEAAPDLEDVVPQVRITPRGAQVIPAATDGAAYAFWFPVLRADSTTDVLAELELPAIDSVQALLAREGLSRRIPMLTRRTDGGSHRLYLAAELAEIPFNPGPYNVDGPLWLRQLLSFGKRRYQGKDAYWRFYVPAMRTLLRAPEQQ